MKQKMIKQNRPDWGDSETSRGKSSGRNKGKIKCGC